MTTRFGALASASTIEAVVAAAGGGGSGGSSAVFETKAKAQAATVGPSLDAIVLLGSVQAGDSGQMLVCKRRTGVPSHQGYVQTADAVVFEYVLPPEGIAIEWFGGAADLDWIAAQSSGVLNGTDNWPASVAVQEAFTFFTTGSSNGIWNGARVLFKNGGAYGFSRSIEMHRTAVWEGHNTGLGGSAQGTLLVFAAGAHGFYAHSQRTTHVYTITGGKITGSAPGPLTSTNITGPASNGSTIRNLRLRSLGGQEGIGVERQFTPWNTGFVHPAGTYLIAGAGRTYICTTQGSGASTVKPTHTSGANAPGGDGYVWTFVALPPVAHGVYLRAPIRVENCAIDYFNGDLIHAYAVAGGDYTSWGNANLFRLKDLVLENGGRDGVYLEGPDVNAGHTEGINSQHNFGWGIRDNSFLGNPHYNAHTDGNGKRNIALNGYYRLYKVTVDPGVGKLTAVGSEPLGLTTGAQVIGPDGYGWTRLDKGHWVYGTSYNVGDIIFTIFRDGHHRVVTKGPGVSTVRPPYPPLGGPLADGYVWAAEDLSGPYLVWAPGQDPVLNSQIAYGGFVYYCDNPAQGHVIEPGIVAPSTLVQGVDNAVWKVFNSRPVGTWDNYRWSASQVYIDGGSYASDQATAAGTMFIGCYIEGDQPPCRIAFPAQIWGGLGPGPTRRAMDPAGGMFSGRLMQPFTTVSAWTSSSTIDAQTNMYPSLKLAHSYKDDQLLTVTGGVFGFTGAEVVGYRNDIKALQRGVQASTSEWMTALGTTLTGGRVETLPPGELMYLKGIHLGEGSGGNIGGMRKLTAGSAPPAPSLGGEYARGQVIFNTDPSPGGNAGWICTTGGVTTSQVWAAGVEYEPAYWVLAAGGRYYHCTLRSGGLSVAGSEPTHTGLGVQVIGADGIGWTYLGTTVAVWKTFGTIAT